MFFEFDKIEKEVKMKKRKIYPKYTIEEKNNIIMECMSGTSSYSTLLKKYDIANKSMLHK